MRKAGLFLVAAMALTAVVGCSTKESGTESSGTSTSSSTTERATGTSEGTGSSGGTGASESASTSDQCQAVLLLMGGVSVGGALPEGQARDELEQQIADARQKVPADLQDDIDTIGDGVQDADGIVAWGRFLASQEYRDAIGNLQQFLTDNCGADDLLPN